LGDLEIMALELEIMSLNIEIMSLTLFFLTWIPRIRTLNFVDVEIRGLDLECQG
jgi:hypothetical protein